LARTKNFDEQEILEKILLLFGQRGFHQSSLDDILQAAGISRQSVYDTYGDKRTLFIRALNLYWEQMTAEIEARIQREIANGKSSLEILRGLLYQENGEQGKEGFIVNSIVEFRTEYAEIRAEIEKCHHFLQGKIAGLVAGGQEAGEITTAMSAVQITALMMNAWSGLQIGRDFDLAAGHLREVADWTVDLIRVKV
jgi:TetR/AcrR family transcriptional repressor of nem operon